MEPDPEAGSAIPSIDEIRSRTFEAFGKRPCLWQACICDAILKGNQDVISIAGTGMGKTLTFWMPLLFRPQGILLVITPLNMLGKQNVETLEKAGINGIFISARTASDENFRAIASLRYRVVVVNPEELLRHKGGFEKLMKDRLFANSLICIVIDEAHCISQWGSFRPEYRHIGQLAYVQHNRCPFLITSATLSPAVILDVKKVLHLDDNRLLFSRCSVNRANFAIVVRPILHSLSSFSDLQFLLNGWKPGDPPPPKFLVFFDNIQTSILATKALHHSLPKEQRHRINWFNSEMSDSFKEEEADNLKNGETWGLMTMDSFGMGMDIPDIRVVVQWRATLPSISTIWQHFGRCVRDPSLQGTVYLFVEKEHFDVERRRSEITKETKKRKRAATTTKPTKSPRTQLGTSGRREARPDDDPNGDKEQVEEQTKNVRTKNDKKSKIDPAVDDVVNADERGIGCRRQPLIATFQDAMSVSSHIDCDPSMPGGCGRCRPAPVQLCCDLHNPELVAQCNTSESLTSKAHTLPRRSNLPALNEMNQKDRALEYDLEIWRRDKTKKKYGIARLKHEGPGVVMAGAIREHIVKCAHFGKIKMIANLERETHWFGSQEYGSEIIKIIEKHYPQPQPAVDSAFAPQIPSDVQALASHINPPAVQPGMRTKRISTCSVCNQPGHNMKNKAKCRGPLSTQLLLKENIPPLLPSPLPRTE